MTLVHTPDPIRSVFASDRRATDRIDVVIWTRISLADDSEYPARITNISTAGLMAMSPCGCAEDIAVRIKLPDLGWVEGVICWRMGDRIGIEFDELMGVENFSALAPYCI